MTKRKQAMPPDMCAAKGGTPLSQINARGEILCEYDDAATPGVSTGQTPTGQTAPLAASDLNPDAIAKRLIEVGNIVSSAQQGIANGIQAGLTQPNVAGMTAQQAINEQLKQQLAPFAAAADQAQIAIQAQLAGALAGVGEGVMGNMPNQQAPGGQPQIINAPKNAGDGKGNAGFPDNPNLVRPGTWASLTDITFAQRQQFDAAGALGNPISITGTFGFDKTGPTDQWCEKGFTPVTVDGNKTLIACVKDAVLQGPAQNVAPPPATDSPVQKQADTTNPPAASSDCMKVEICNWPDSKATTTDCKYTLWQTKGGTCYILKATDKQRSSDDKQLATGEPSDSWLAAIVSGCGGSKSNSQSTSKPSSNSNSSSGIVSSCLGTPLPFIINQASIGQFLKDHGIDLDQALIDGVLSPLDIATNPLGALTKAAKFFPAAWLTQVFNAINLFAGLGGCLDAQSIQERLTLSVLELAKYISGDALNALSYPIKYDMDSRCPYLLPTAADAVSAYLANTIDQDKLQCLVTANANIWEQYQPLVYAARSKHSALDLASLNRRKVISDSEFQTRVRELGYLNSSDPGEILKLTELIPGPQDIVRFMVRDADNQDVVNTFQLDTGFEQNFDKQLREWAANQGVSELYMRYLWRAHWDIPSPTQLFEMYKRLRHSTEFNPEGKLQSDIQKALVQQDIAPYWIDRLLALSFNPLTRTDARRAYEIGSIDKSELWNSFIDGGYSDENATRLVEFTDKQLQLKFYRHPLVSQYAKGQVASSELEQALSFEGATADHIAAAKQRAGILARINSRKACTSSLKKQFFLGEVDQMDLTPKLTQLGIDDDIASQLSTAWVCERAARGKTVPARQLARLFREGIIDEAKFLKNLIGLGYTGDAAMDLIAEQQGLITADRAKQKEADLKKARVQAEQQAKQQAAAAKQAVKDMQAKNKDAAAAMRAADQAAKQAAANFAKQQAAAAKGLATINARRVKLRNIILDTATYISKATGEYLGDVLDKIQAYTTTAKASGIDPIAFAECGLHAAKIFTGSDDSEFFKNWTTCWQAPPVATEAETDQDGGG